MTNYSHLTYLAASASSVEYRCPGIVNLLMLPLPVDVMRNSDASTFSFLRRHINQQT